MADGDDDEVMLELSIGGIFGRPKKSNQNDEQKKHNVALKNKDTKGEIDLVLQRRELRRKREEKVKKSVDFGSCGSVSGPFVENKEWLDAQIVRRNAEPARKKEKVGDVMEKIGSVLMAPGDDGGGQVVAPVDGDLNCVFRQTACRSYRPYQGNMNLKANDHETETDGGGGCCCKMKGCASLAYSDGQCSSHQGGVTDDSRSNSSNSQLDQQLASTSIASVEPFDPSDQPTGSSKQAVSTSKLTNSNSNSNSNVVRPNAQTNPHESTVSNPHSKPETSSQHQQASLLARMPCVSTTGNGPNGRTISGFLYRYTKHEVSIVCVCHGRSFSPAGFVEHAGGVDIAHPLKHITIFPAAFAS